jgi:hypothetical protein
LWADTPVETRPEGLVLRTPPYFGSDAQPVLRDGNFLFFRVQDGRLLRILTPVDIRGHSLTPKSFTLVPPEKQLKPSKLYQDLFAPRSARDWFTVRHARNYPN